MSKRTLRAKHTERSRKRRERETRDAIAKLKARPDPVVVNDFPDDPVLHQIVRDENGTFWKRNQTHTGWDQFLDDSAAFSIPIVNELPPIPISKAQLVWYDGQLWGSAPIEPRWYPAMRYTNNDGSPG